MKKRTLMLVLLGSLFTAALMAGRPSQYHEFAQVVDGGPIRTSFLVVNSGTSPAQLDFTFWLDDGTPWALSIDGNAAPALSVQVPAGGMVKITTDSVDNVAVSGWARMTASERVGAQCFLEIFTGDELTTQAAIESSGPVRNVDLFVEQNETTSTGLAVANLSETGPTRIVLTVKSEDGQIVDSTEITLPPRGHRARFLPELIEGLGTVRGSLALSASGPVVVVTLLQSGLVLGTLPVVVRNF